MRSVWFLISSCCRWFVEKPEDEIELVCGHFRDEDHLNDPEDLPHVNMVSVCSLP